MKLCALVLFASALVFAPVAKADSITLTSHTGNNYKYDITFNESKENVFFLSGFRLTDLDGVTNAVLSGELADSFVVLFDSTSVTVGTFFSEEEGKKIPFSVGTLTVTSAAQTGTIDFAIKDSNGRSTGTVTGPDAATVPEPSSIAFLGTGLLAAAGAVRRRFIS